MSKELKNNHILDAVRIQAIIDFMGLNNLYDLIVRNNGIPQKHDGNKEYNLPAGNSITYDVLRQDTGKGWDITNKPFTFSCFDSGATRTAFDKICMQIAQTEFVKVPQGTDKTGKELFKCMMTRPIEGAVITASCPEYYIGAKDKSGKFIINKDAPTQTTISFFVGKTLTDAHAEYLRLLRRLKRNGQFMKEVDNADLSGAPAASEDTEDTK